VVLTTRDVTPERLRAAVERVLRDGTFRQRAADVRASLRTAGGVTAAADAVWQFTGALRATYAGVPGARCH
jgi:UDP:flavonoid glycosyltransferase YjiC (YdhE family)